MEGLSNMNKRKALSLRVAVAALVAAATAIGAGTASAHSSAGAPGVGKYTQGCPTFDTSEPFTPWTDTGDYFLGPAADFEGSLTGWTAKNAKIVSGNESYYVNSPTDSHSLSLPKGSSATTPSICVTLDTPQLRMFVKNTGASATLQINMTYTNNQGKPSTSTVAKLAVGAKADWAPIAPVLFLSKITSILSNNNQTWVTFQLASNGSLLVDDFYVDPIKHH
jgi:hypothetical protein